MRYLRQRRGAVLIVVLGVLAVLALLATTFATLQTTEKQVARNYLDTVRAKLAAQSGVQEAEQRLREQFPARYFEGLDLNPPRPRSWKYWGDDLTERTDPLPDHKLDDARNPSFAVERDDDPLNQNPEPKQLKINGKDLGYSGTHGGGFYGLNSEHYALKVSDISGRIHVNDGVDNDPKAGADTSVSQNLRRILNILGDVQTIPQLGDKIISMRPPGGYRHVNDLLRCVNFDEASFNRFRDYVTVNAWVDKNVANPVPLSPFYADEQYTGGVKYYRGDPSKDPQSPAQIYRAGSEVRGIDANNKAVTFGAGGDRSLLTYDMMSQDAKAQRISIHGLDTLNPQWIEIVARAPVNINAASKPVLVSLLTGIRGFFIGYRRRNNPNYSGELYLSFKGQNPLRPAGLGVVDMGDDYGVLMDTVEIVNEKQTTDDRKISAWVIAEEIVACRERRNTPHCNYSDKDRNWFAGPFRDWHQFNAFIDNLARPKNDKTDPGNAGPGILRDNRPVHWDYHQNGDLSGGGTLVGLPNAEAQMEHASKAIADALKANFNPNLHLNEANPDENLYLRVDKTDLFVNSTEFCFLPTGYFEIESLGRVVKRADGQVGDISLSANNVLVAQAKVKAVFKLYDMIRETTQKHFYAGTLSPGGSSFPTSNGKSLEVGPEPDNGVFRGNFGEPGEADNEWGGYIAFPTVGGPAGFNKQKNTLVRTKALGNKRELGAVFQVHFALDQDADGHELDQTEIGSGKAGLEDEVENYPDWVGRRTTGRPWTVGGPYNPGMSTPTTQIRIARSFRLSKNQSGTVTAPLMEPYPPSDLRIDGSYVERHSAPCYLITKNGSSIWDWTQERSAGLISFWWKPSYFPELTGKVRSMFDLSRYHYPCDQKVWVWPFAMWFYPVNYDPPFSEDARPEYSHNNMGKFNPVSVVWGSKTWHNTNRAHEFGNLSGCLNHEGHIDMPCFQQGKKWNILKAHRWIHTALKWNLTGVDQAGVLAEMHLNGNKPDSTQYEQWLDSTYRGYNYWRVTGHSQKEDRMPEFGQHSNYGSGSPGSFNQMRFGGASSIAKSMSGDPELEWGYRGNFAGDHTIDEIYVWKTADPSPRTIWLRGRYSSPDGQYGEGRFDSAPLELDKSLSDRRLAAPSNAVAPGGGGGGTVAQPPSDPKRFRVLGMSWTWYGESLTPYERTLGPYQQGGYTGQKYLAAWEHTYPKEALKPTVKVTLYDATTNYGEFQNEYFSPVMDPDGQTPIIKDPKTLKYRVEMSSGAAFGQVLLATAVFDDITLFIDDNQSHLLSYIFDNRSF